MLKIQLDKFNPLSNEVNFDADKLHKIEYGRLLEDFEEGDVYYHPRGFTIDRSFAQEFATTFHEANPLFLSVVYAKAHGFTDLLVSPLQVFNIVLSLGVQNNSEKAVANLGYYNIRFISPVYPGDTITSCTQILSKRERGKDKPGIVHVRTLGLNQNSKVVLEYERKIMISPYKSGEKKKDRPPVPKTLTNIYKSKADLELPQYTANKNLESHIDNYTGQHSYFENFEKGMTFVHKNMRTITDEHVAWTYRMGNTHPLHYDRIYSQGLSGKMSGEPIVYGGLVFAWLIGLASRDTTENMLWDLGYIEGYHTQPAISGDTIGTISRILHLEKEPNGIKNIGLVQLQIIGVKNIATAKALEKYGADLFIKENDKKKLGKEKISEKIFEIERRVLLKSNS